MRFLLPIMVAAAVLLGPSTSLGAMDYSQLVDPPHARVFLIPGKRLQQVGCAGLALHLRQTNPAFDNDTASRLVEGVARRLTVDLGDKEVAAWYIEGQARHHSAFTREAKSKAAEVDILKGQCRSLFEQAKKGDAELATVLGPIPSEPLKLPDPGLCLAYVSYAAEGDGVDGSKDMKALLQEAWIDQAAGSEQAKRKADLMTTISMLRSLAPDSDYLNRMVFACAPALNGVTKNSGATSK